MLTRSVEIKYINSDFNYLTVLLTQLYAVKQLIYCRKKNSVINATNFEIIFFHIKKYIRYDFTLFIFISFSFWSNKTFFSFISAVSSALLYENTLHSWNSEEKKIMYYADNENKIKAKYSRWKKKIKLDLFLSFCEIYKR